MAFGRIYPAFAAAYLLSYVYRTANAVISPDLTRELAVDPAALGLLTGAYFLAFALMQLPAGMLLDRYGPRRVEPVLLALAALGAIGFGIAGSLPELVAARALIGLGVSVCLMAPLKGIAVWYPPDRHASLAGWMMVAGGVGALCATAPLELALRAVSWRAVFVALGAATIVVAIAIAWRVPDVSPPRERPGLAAQWQGVRAVLADRRFWWIAPLGGFGMGSFMAIQGLWAVPWMMDVAGLTRAEAARHLLAMGVVVLAGYVALGTFATRLAHRGIAARHLFAAGFGTHAVVLAIIVAELPGSYVWWSLYGLGAAANVLAFSVLNEGFARELAARANTSLNLMMFLGSFATQWGIGIVVALARDRYGLSAASGLRLAFVAVLALDVLAFAWFAAGWRRHTARRRVPAAA
jgi:MFS family permease